MRILLTGSKGQVGSALVLPLTRLGEVSAFDRQGLDLLDSRSIRNAIAKVKPDIIINAAAYTAVDRAVRERDLAYAVNVEAVKELAREANTIGSKSQDAGIAHAVVELKTEIERMREQVQNVE